MIIRNETANEDNERRLQQRNSQIFPFGPPPNLMLLPGLSSETPFPQGEATLRFIQQIKQKNPNVGCVFFNTVAGIRERSSKEKNYDATEAEFSALGKLSHELEIAIVAVHHNRKQTESDAAPLEQILGSKGIAATALILQQAVQNIFQHLQIQTGGRPMSVSKYRTKSGIGY